MFGKKDAKKGMTVRRASGESLGPIVEIEGKAIIIDGGRKTEYIAEFEQIEDIRNGEVWLRERVAEEQPTAGAGAAAEAGRDVRRIPLVSEELEVSKRQRQAGEVNVRKTVTEERRDVTVPVTREEVRVERVPASAETAGQPDASAFREETVSVPVTEEEVEIRKRPVVREELRVTKERQVEQRVASETVRREDAEVDDRTDRSRRPDDETTGPKRHS